jgi:hypothetical protein
MPLRSSGDRSHVSVGFLSDLRISMQGPIDFIANHFVKKQQATMDFFPLPGEDFLSFLNKAPCLTNFILLAKASTIMTCTTFLHFFLSTSRSSSVDIRSHEGAREQKYRILYDDIVANKQMWMDWFDIRDNYRHVENVCGILVRTFLNFAQKQLVDFFCHQSM